MVCRQLGILTEKLQAAEVLANSVDGAKSVHRVPIVDAESGRVTKLVTQSAMLKFIDAVSKPVRSMCEANLF